MKRSRKILEKSERLTVTLGGGQREKVESIAKRLRTSAATVIRWALDEYIEANKQTANGSLKPK